MSSLIHLDLINILKNSQTYQSFIKTAKSEKPQHQEVWVKALCTSAKAQLLTAILNDRPSKAIAILPSEAEAENFFHDLKFFNPDANPLFFPEERRPSVSDFEANLKRGSERIAVLDQIMTQPQCLIVSSVKAVMPKLPEVDRLKSAILKVEAEMEIDLQKLTEELSKFGYSRVSAVESKGEFALRGGILDVFPLTSKAPARIEFFGDQVDSIREFNLNSQRSTKKLQSVRIPPADYQTLYQGIQADSNLAIIIDYLPKDSLVYLCEPLWSSKEVDRTLDQLDQAGAENSHIDENPPPYADFESIIEACQKHKLVYATLSQQENDRLSNSFHFDFRPLSLANYGGNFQLVLDKVKSWKSEGKKIILLSDNPKQAERLFEIFAERGIEGLTVSLGEVSYGFFSEALNLVLIPENEIFSRRRIYRKHARYSEGLSIRNFSDLKAGDYMVHMSHGIGIYEGLKQLNLDEKQQDFLVLRYAGGDLLYVPVYQLDMVGKYSGGEEARLKLDKLGGGTWQRTKKRVKESVEKMAKELIELYAYREALEGFSFSPDTPWQREFEAAFPYEETPDQFRAIEDVKMDMERLKPMDRLICGDVGYGKTEVAMRAAFKAVMDGKQAAMLVPTTVLAQQHYRTFSQRFDQYPVKIEMMSRFKTAQEQKEILKSLAENQVDIIIGTHRLLQKDVKFHKLGLLIIDEEHRFGVKQKENLKALRKTVDVLTLTATPIPRTLHMSVTGIRDMSVIDTPPENRLPIETYLMPYKPEIVMDAVSRELDRGGQVFFVNNRIQNISSIAKSIQELLPSARIAVAHGRMPERQLEQIMIDFVNYKYDILVCTTIIESGLDIPNANTIIINRADALGLAQLYQLRGRVGRDRYKSYGYLLYPEDRAITEDSQKRLRAIEEFTELGSGFKIALRDLEIRGSGNLLGAEQHGHIVSVGYDMYCKILEETVKELKGEEVIEKLETKINLSLEAYLPDDYVPDERLKMDLYKRIAETQSKSETEDLEAEIIDRFGKLPLPVKYLLAISDLKRLAQSLGVDAIVSTPESVKVSFDKNHAAVDPRKLINLIRLDDRLSLSPPVRLTIETGQMEKENGLKIVNVVKEVLEKLK